MAVDERERMMQMWDEHRQELYGTIEDTANALEDAIVACEAIGEALNPGVANAKIEQWRMLVASARRMVPTA